jgi:hypothetical protein
MKPLFKESVTFKTALEKIPFLFNQTFSFPPLWGGVRGG